MNPSVQPQATCLLGWEHKPVQEAQTAPRKIFSPLQCRGLNNSSAQAGEEKLLSRGARGWADDGGGKNLSDRGDGFKKISLDSYRFLLRDTSPRLLY